MAIVAQPHNFIKAEPIEAYRLFGINGFAFSSCYGMSNIWVA